MFIALMLASALPSAVIAFDVHSQPVELKWTTRGIVPVPVALLDYDLAGLTRDPAVPGTIRLNYVPIQNLEFDIPYVEGTSADAASELPAELRSGEDGGLRSLRNEGADSDASGPAPPPA